jgi:hypothetical protein
VPAGFLLALTAWRTGRSRRVILRATLACAGLSLVLEALQSYLPDRVPSNVDLALNIAGGWCGAVLATAMEKSGAIDRWSRVRARWFLPDASGGMVLLALWPAALLFPAAVPLGLGQVLERLEALVECCRTHPSWSGCRLREVELQPLVPGAEFCLCDAGHADSLPGRILHHLVAPPPARVRLDGPGRRRADHRPVGRLVLRAAARLGLVAAAGARRSGALSGAGRSAADGTPRASAAVALLGLGVYLSLLNQAPADPYFSQTLQTWEQGRFIRFHGLAQWLGWLWPYATLVYLLSKIWRQEGKN